MAIERVLILDTETTGLDPAVDCCIEVACILYDLELATPLASYSSLIRAESNAAEAVNRIPVLALSEAYGARESSQVWAGVAHFANRADAIVAHRADFDRAFVNKPLRTQLPWVCSKFHVEWPRGKSGDSLVPLALAHGLGIVSAHRAMTDCDILARLLTRVAEMGHPLVALFDRAMRPRVKVAAVVSYDDREMAKAAGFAWEPKTKTWWRDMPVEEIASLPFTTRALESAP